MILGSDANCGLGLRVLALTLQQPGRIDVIGNNMALQGIPSTFKGTDAITNMPLVLSPGHDVQRVVSFTLQPTKDARGKPLVCVQDIQEAQRVIKS